MKILTFRYSLVLLVGLLIQWWVFYFSPFSIPDRIPSTPIKIEGLALVGYIVTVLIFFQRSLLKVLPSMGMLNLTLLGALMCFLAEITFQIIRVPTLEAGTMSERIYYFMYGVIGVSAFAAVFSFLVAFQLKTKKTGQLLLLIIAFLFIIYVLKLFFLRKQEILTVQSVTGLPVLATSYNTLQTHLS